MCIRDREGSTFTSRDTIDVAHWKTTVAPLVRLPGKDQVSTSVVGAVTAVTGKRIWEPLESGGSMWKIWELGSSTMVHAPDCRTANQTEYLPLGTEWPSSVIGLL